MYNNNNMYFFLVVFPTVHFNAYCPGFIGQYCRVSALLELESLMSQQALREAFSEAELLAAKKKHQQVQEHMQVRPHSQPAKDITAWILLHKDCCDIIFLWEMSIDSSNNTFDFCWD